MQNPLSPDIWRELHQGCQTLTREQEKRFLKAARRADPQTRALCELLYWTGCRLSEAIALRRDHIDTDHDCVIFRTLKQRGRGQLRAVPVPRSLIRLLYALPAPSGRLWSYSRWTARRRLQPVFHAADLHGPSATSRVFRHSFNARAIRRGVPDRVRRTLLGHQTQHANNQYGQLLGYELRSFARRVWPPRWGATLL
ncbi:MAG: tyrosine-type recombinase/integrase [Pseudomonadota bacterium]